MLPRLDEDPVDTQQVIPQYTNIAAPPKHQVLRFLGYLFAGFLVFVVVFTLTSIAILYYFRINCPTFVESTKKDAYSLVGLRNSDYTVTPIPKSIVWLNYTNSVEHYSVMYPPDWIRQEDTSEGTILFPPGSRQYAQITQADIGSGLGPRIFIVSITRPFVIPDDKYTTITTDSGIQGYEYVDSTSGDSTIDFPLNNKKEILEFSTHNIGQDNIDEHLKAHQSDLVVKDIDQDTLEKIVKTLKVTN